MKVWNNFNRPVYLLPAVCYTEEKKMYTRSRAATVQQQTVKTGHICRSRKSFHGVGKAGKEDLGGRNNY